MRALKSIIVGIGILGAAGCASESLDTQEEGLTLTEQSETRIAGTYVDGDMVLSFDANMPEQGIIQISYEIDGIVVASQLDLNQGVGSYDFGGAALDQSHKVAFQGAHDALMAAIEQEETGTTPQGQLERQLSYLAEAPLGEPIAAFDYSVDRGWTHLSCTCKNQYIGSGYYRTAGRGCSCGGGNGCKGRCGAGCGGWGWVSYTRDCAKHDYGLGSWGAASDDYCCSSNNCNGGC